MAYLAAVATNCTTGTLSALLHELRYLRIFRPPHVPAFAVKCLRRPVANHGCEKIRPTFAASWQGVLRAALRYGSRSVVSLPVRSTPKRLRNIIEHHNGYRSVFTGSVPGCATALFTCTTRVRLRLFEEMSCAESNGYYVNHPALRVAAWLAVLLCSTATTLSAPAGGGRCSPVPIPRPFNHISRAPSSNSRTGDVMALTSSLACRYEELKRPCAFQHQHQP